MDYVKIKNREFWEASKEKNPLNPFNPMKSVS